MTGPATDAVVDLSGVPALGGLYVRGAAGSATKRPRRGDVVLPGVTYRVAEVPTADRAAHLRAYQDVVVEPPSDVLPAGFLHVLTFPVTTALMTRPDFPLPLLGMVHLRNAVRVLHPVRLGDVLEVRATAQDARPHRRGVQVDVVTEVSVGGGLAYRGVSTYLAKGFTLPGADATGQADGGPSEVREDWAPPLPTGRWTLGADTGREYAAVSGDRNPIHTSALGARAFGFPRPIAHGMYTAARALAEVGPALRGESYEWTVDFLKPVLLPGTVDVAIVRATDGPGHVYDGWRSGKGTHHFRGAVTPLT